ncbi:alpha/beta hydrolase, partial [bacterium]|nr:alpha/beta hydrolase [bacterium]
MIERRNISFPSEGLTCAGWFYSACTREAAPCII